MLQKISELLNAPFAETESPLMIVRNMAIASVIVFLILYLFQPFELAGLGGDLWWVCIVFGLITFVIGFIYEYTLHFIIPIKKRSERWTLKFWILSITGMIICIAIGNYMFLIYLADNLSFYWKAMLIMVANTFVVAIIPTIISGLIVQNRNLKMNLDTARKLDASLHASTEDSKNVTINSQEQKDTFTCPAHDLIAVESMQNYIAITYKEVDTVKRAVIRNSLKNTCRQICNGRIIRCHRSFIVNISHVLHITGNAQGLQLELSTGQHLPVSRSYIKTVRMALETT